MNALQVCNGCDAAPMAAGQDAPGQPGYCAGCLTDANGWTGSLSVSDLEAVFSQTTCGRNAREAEAELIRRGY